MTELDYLKMGHEIKDVVDMATISRYINDLENITQQGRWFDVDGLFVKLQISTKQRLINITKGGYLQKHLKKEHWPVTTF